jgi:bifunctional ADP-heptose synthase (sugar kinase/adenylyltransferase)
VVCLNSDDSVRRLKGGDRPLVGPEDRVAVLSALDCVDGTMPEDEVLTRWGGRSVVVPYLPGRSTSELLARARTPASV